MSIKMHNRRVPTLTLLTVAVSLGLFGCSDSDNSFNDDELYSRKYNYQISIFSQDNSHYKVQNTIDSLMRSLGFTCYHNDEVYEPDVKVFHRVLLYSRTLSNEQASILEAKYL